MLSIIYVENYSSTVVEGCHAPQIYEEKMKRFPMGIFILLGSEMFNATRMEKTGRLEEKQQYWFVHLFYSSVSEGLLLT